MNNYILFSDEILALQRKFMHQYYKKLNIKNKRHFENNTDTNNSLQSSKEYCNPVLRVNDILKNILPIGKKQ